MRPILVESAVQDDLTFRGDILGDVVFTAAKEVESQRAKDERGKTPSLNEPDFLRHRYTYLLEIAYSNKLPMQYVKY